MDVNADLAGVLRRIEALARWEPFPDTGAGLPPFPAPIRNRSAHGSSAFDPLIRQSAAAWRVDPALVKAVIASESAFDANAASATGAQGLMQLEPGTASELGVRQPFDPAQNIWGGTRYIRGLLDRFHHNLPLAVAAYNAGPEAVEKYRGIPPYAETQTYVRRVLASYDMYKRQL